jgi:hypothetical protein
VDEAKLDPTQWQNWTDLGSALDRRKLRNDSAGCERLLKTGSELMAKTFILGSRKFSKYHRPFGELQPLSVLISKACFSLGSITYQFIGLGIQMDSQGNKTHTDSNIL